MKSPSFTGCNTAHYIGAIFYHLCCMKSTFRTSKTLNYYFGIFVYKNAHFRPFSVDEL
ncbi:hypothetical protein DSECCO2_593700 [anaerobic digester metagenome]